MMIIIIIAITLCESERAKGNASEWVGCLAVCVRAKRRRVYEKCMHEFVFACRWQSLGCLMLSCIAANLFLCSFLCTNENGKTGDWEKSGANKRMSKERQSKQVKKKTRQKCFRCEALSANASIFQLNSKYTLEFSLVLRISLEISSTARTFLNT